MGPSALIFCYKDLSQWNITPDNNGKSVVPDDEEKRCGWLSCYPGQQRRRVRCSRERRAFNTYNTPIHWRHALRPHKQTNLVSGYTIIPYGRTPLSGYVDITGLHRVLSHAKCGYVGQAFIGSRHVAVYDSARTNVDRPALSFPKVSMGLFSSPSTSPFLSFLTQIFSIFSQHLPCPRVIF